MWYVNIAWVFTKKDKKMVKKVRGKFIAKVKPSDGRSKAIKPNLGKDTGGFIVIPLKAKVKKDKEKKQQKSQKNG